MDSREYNRQPLAVCDASYIGQATPKKTIEYPEIVLEPLKQLYSACRHKRSDLRAATSISVRIYIYNSGMIIKELNSDGKNKVNWFPIQNLYCSAGFKPDKGKKGGSVIFRHLHEKVKSATTPIFAMVVRQPGNDGRRLLMCHAFIVNYQVYVEQLIKATKLAYSNKSAWNHPINDKEFLNAKISYALQRLEEEEASLDELKITTEERDKKLAQHPDLSTMTQQHVTRSRARSAKHVKPQSAPVSPRRVMIASRPQSIVGSSRPPSIVGSSRPPSVVGGAVGGARLLVMQPRQSTIPTPRAIAYYRGFNTDTISNTPNDYAVAKPASVSGFPLSRSSSNGTAAMSAQQSPGINIVTNGFRPVNGSKSRRHHRSSGHATPRGHRVLASSEPQEAVNGLSNGNGFTVMDWNETVDDSQLNVESPSTSKKEKYSRHHRPSKKMMEMYSHQNGDVNGNSLDEDPTKRNRRSSWHSEKSDSSYSITKIDNPPATSLSNGFFQAHEHADQVL